MTDTTAWEVSAQTDAPPEGARRWRVGDVAYCVRGLYGPHPVIERVTVLEVDGHDVYVEGPSGRRDLYVWKLFATAEAALERALWRTRTSIARFEEALANADTGLSPLSRASIQESIADAKSALRALGAE